MKPAFSRIAAADKEHHAIIARDFSASRMNATKWQEMAEALQEIPWVCRFRWVYEPDVSAWMSAWLPYPGSTYFDTASAGPFRTFTIEWMEIDTRRQWGNRGLLVEDDQTPEIERRLQEINVPYEWVDGYIRVVGHVRNS
jgi:hypothetical protein